MESYYAVERSENHLAHYGVKGMRWGVRRAIERGNDRALRRHYSAAARKLQALSARSDRDFIQKAKKQNLKTTASSALASGLASGGMTYALNSHLPAKNRALLSAAVGGGMAAANAIAGGVNHAVYSRWGSKSGHAKQVAKRNQFEREMRNSFKGTKYAKQINRTKDNIYKNINDVKRAMDPSRNYSNRKRRK